jgi:hypothetical protein
MPSFSGALGAVDDSLTRDDEPADDPTAGSYLASMDSQTEFPEIRSTDMCVRCKKASAPEPLGLCASCVVHTRIEVCAGLALLNDYLEAWAAFDRWLEERKEP